MTTPLSADMFNFNAIKETAGDPFAKQSSGYKKDDRFYTLKKDENKSGAAIVRFLPDSEMGTIREVILSNAQIAPKRFITEFSPQNAGLPCPIQEKWQELWNAGNKEEAKKYGRGIAHIANMYIVKDPACPENEGKVFLYKMSTTMRDKIQAALTPSKTDIALGATPKEMFNPIAGHNFKLACSLGSNGQVSYDASGVVSEQSSLFADPQQAVDFIKANCHTLSDLVKPENLPTYDELATRLAGLEASVGNAQPQVKQVQTLAQSAGVTQAQATPQVQTAQTAQTEPQVQTVVTQTQAAPQQSIDEMLAGM